MPISSIFFHLDSLHFEDSIPMNVVSIVAVGKLGAAISFKQSYSLSSDLRSSLKKEEERDYLVLQFHYNLFVGYLYILPSIHSTYSIYFWIILSHNFKHCFPPFSLFSCPNLQLGQCQFALPSSLSFNSNYFCETPAYFHFC